MSASEGGEGAAGEGREAGHSKLEDGGLSEGVGKDREEKETAAGRKVAEESSSSDEEESEEFKALWQRVEKVLAEYHLSRFAMVACKRWVRLMGDERNTHLTRIRDWLLLRVNSKKRAKPLSHWQMGCPDVVPGLRASAFWSREMEGMQWVAEVEANFSVIKEELLALRGQNGFQPFRQPSWSTKLAAADEVGAVSHDKGDWNVFYLFLHNQRFEENCAKCPKTVAFIDRVAPRQYKHAFFSALNPGTHVIAHTGPTNKKLRVHLPLLGVQGSRLRVADQVFDDSFEHEVLIFDVWHPDFSDEEVKFLSYLQKSQMKAEREASEEAEGDDNFFALLRKTKHLLPNHDWWISAAGDADAEGEEEPRAAEDGAAKPEQPACKAADAQVQEKE